MRVRTIFGALVIVAAVVDVTAVVSAPRSVAQADVYADTVGEGDPAAVEGSMAPCEVEDGSGPSQVLPCFWNASVAGNGIGLSFVVTSVKGRLFYTYLDAAANKLYGGF